jgi:hypothetical protein
LAGFILPNLVSCMCVTIFVKCKFYQTQWEGMDKQVQASVDHEGMSSAQNVESWKQSQVIQH